MDLDRAEIRIWPNDEWQPKNGKPREIPISDGLRPFLEGERSSPKWVFHNSDGERFASFPKAQFYEAQERAKLSGGPHRLRHTFASIFLAKEPDLGLLAVVLGHSDEAVTRLYAHMLPGRLARARNVVSVTPPDGKAMAEARRVAMAKANARKSTGAEAKNLPNLPQNLPHVGGRLRVVP